MSQFLLLFHTSYLLKPFSSRYMCPVCQIIWLYHLNLYTVYLMMSIKIFLPPTCSSFYLLLNSISPSTLAFNFNVLSSSSSLPPTLIKIYSQKQSISQYYLRKKNWFPWHIHLSLLLLYWNILIFLNRSYITTKMGKVNLKKNCDLTIKYFLFTSWY